MICNLILFVIQTILNVLLLPLQALDFAIDIVSSISIVSDFIKVIAYLFPWGNIMPLIFFVIAMFGFRAIVSLIKTIWDLIPVL